jgi:hypothetical protein
VSCHRRGNGARVKGASFANLPAPRGWTWHLAQSALVRVVHSPAEWCQVGGTTYTRMGEDIWMAHGGHGGGSHPFPTSEPGYPVPGSVHRSDLPGSLTTINAGNIRFVLGLGPKFTPQKSVRKSRLPPASPGSCSHPVRRASSDEQSADQ